MVVVKRETGEKGKGKKIGKINAVPDHRDLI
jgi:hypothetical protein